MTMQAVRFQLADIKGGVFPEAKPKRETISYGACKVCGRDIRGPEKPTKADLARITREHIRKYHPKLKEKYGFNPNANRRY